MRPTTAEFQNLAGMWVAQTLRSFHLNFSSSGRTTCSSAWEIRIPFIYETYLKKDFFFLIIPLPVNSKFSKLLFSPDLLIPDGTPQTISFGKY